MSLLAGVSSMSADVVRGWRADLATGSLPTDDVGRWELLRAAEELKAAAAALQARVCVAFEESQRSEQQAAGVDRRDVGRGIAAQVAAARRVSPARGARELGVARALVGELPHTLAALTFGTVTEWRATLMVRETACLSREDRMAVDAELAARPGGLGGLGDRGMEVAARAAAHRLDPYAATRRARKAESDRGVSLRPAPDTMSILSGLLPVRQGVAVWASLTRHADSLRASGDPRSRGQVMADTLVERVTGQASAEAVPMEVQLVMTDHALLGSRDGSARETPAWVTGFGPVPAPLARSWICDTTAQAWVRRLFTDPVTGTLAEMESRRRTFTGRLRRFVVARDQVCRTPWCDAPIRQIDHVLRAAEGGATTVGNAQGLCVACNLAREAPGWSTSRTRDTVVTTIPTGHQHSSSPPALTPRSAGPPAPYWPPPHPGPLVPRSRLEYCFQELILTA
jgi:hypothetical protein